ncbi:hypothetical protein, partial [Treponema succinifaciens]|uniref:hypothetical protein n=1 Tax=Treponema succinifaciens TaxID=167 RepID=UPI0023F1F61A
IYNAFALKDETEPQYNKESKRAKSFVNEYQKIQKMTERLPVSQNLIFGTQDKAIAEKLHLLYK